MEQELNKREKQPIQFLQTFTGERTCKRCNIQVKKEVPVKVVHFSRAFAERRTAVGDDSAPIAWTFRWSMGRNLEEGS